MATGAFSLSGSESLSKLESHFRRTVVYCIVVTPYRQSRRADRYSKWVSVGGSNV